MSDLPKTIDYQFEVSTDDKLGGLHMEIVSADYEGHNVSVSAGFGLGNSDVYVQLDDHRIFTIDTTDFWRTLIDTALDSVEEKT